MSFTLKALVVGLAVGVAGVGSAFAAEPVEGDAAVAGFTVAVGSAVAFGSSFGPGATQAARPPRTPPARPPRKPPSRS